jgi:DHA1 family tetracycline resistance protein-like MFS transporter
MRQVPNLRLPNLRLLFPFFFVIAIDAMCHGIITPILAPLMLKASGSAFGLPLNEATRHIMYGLIQMTATFCYMIGAPLLGYFSDKMGRRKIIFFCLISSTIGLLCYAWSFATNDLVILFIARIIVGFGTGSLAVAQAAIADVTQGSEKAKNIGFIAVAMTVGLVAGPLLGGLLSDPTVYHGFTNTTPFWVAIGLSLLNLLFLVRMVETNPAKPTVHYKLVASLKILLAAPSMLLILATFFLFELGWSLYFQSIAVVLVQTFNLANKEIGLFSSYIGLILSFGLFYGVRMVVGRFSLKQIIQPSLIIGVVALLLGFFFNHLWLQIFIAIPISIVVAFCYAILITLASDKAEQNKQGLLMGTTDCLLALAFTITAFLSGALTISNAVLPQLVAALFWLVGWLLFAFLRKTDKGLIL